MKQTLRISEKDDEDIDIAKLLLVCSLVYGDLSLRFAFRAPFRVAGPTQLRKCADL